MTTILVVDDHAATRWTLSHILKKNGYSPLVAGSGQEALNLLVETPVSLAILDLAMPGMDGLGLLQRIRAMPQYQTLPVIIFTASGQDEDLVSARRAGASAFLTKPASSTDLVETVRRLLA